MKRRNGELGKLRRPMKSKKASEGSYSSILGYVRFLAIWGLVLLADFLLEFRFEYLYPVWLLVKTVQDSYKYQGLLLTMLFVATAIGTDVFCYIFVPVQWLFFAASSYVWVQYVWHTDRGICLSSVSLWLLFVYVEAALRMKDQKALPFNFDLCRPFAAHCIGYPVVTLGYGIKTAASESIRRRTRSKVKSSNYFYHQVLEEALPLELRESRLTDDSKEDVRDSTERQAKKDSKPEDGSDSGSESEVGSSTKSDSNTATAVSADKLAAESAKSSLIEDFDINAENEARELHRRSVNDLNEEAENLINDNRNHKVNNKEPLMTSAKKLSSRRNKNAAASAAASASNIQGGGAAPTPLPPLNNGHVVMTSVGDGASIKPDLSTRLESDVKKLKADLHASRNAESELRSQLSSKTNDDKQKKANLAQLQQDNDNLQNKLHNLVMTRQQDKQSITAIEKKLQEEKKLREKSESQLQSERKAKKQEDRVAARAVALANASRTSACSSSDCKARIADLEEATSKLRWDVDKRDDQLRLLESENCEMRRKEEDESSSMMNRDALMSALRALESRNRYLENTMSTETKIKLQLYATVSDAKRQLEMQAQIIATKDMEISGLRSHITEALALVPSSMYADPVAGSGQYTTPKLGSPIMANSTQTFMPQLDMTALYNQTSAPTPPHNIITSPRYSPTSLSEAGSPVRKSASENNGGLNPQAQDYLPGTSPPL